MSFHTFAARQDVSICAVFNSLVRVDAKRERSGHDEMLIDPTNAETATRWVVPIFSSEIFFLFRLPILLIPVLPPEMINALVDMRGGDGRESSSFRDSISSDEKRREALYARPSVGKYLNMSTVHTAFAVIGLVLNTVWLALWWVAIKGVTPATSRDDHSALRHYIDQTLGAILYTKLGHAGSWVLLSSVILYFFQFRHYKHYIVRLAMHYPGHRESQLPRHLYILSHVSVVNFLFDIPDINLPTTRLTAFLVRTINLYAGLTLSWTLVFIQALTEAFGCYLPGTPYYKLNSGLCPRFLNNPQDVLPPACEAPGSICGSEEVRWKTILAYELHYAFLTLVVSFSIYLVLSVGTRMRFFHTSSRFLVDLSTNKKDV
jgi:hypothetical protein